MSAFDAPEFFGELWAHDYDEAHVQDPAPAVAFLAGLALGGRALELAIGTGRVGLPLSATGLHVEGVEGSPKMVAKLRAKPGGEKMPVVIGDMADVPVAGPFRLVYLVYNTLFNLLDPTRQADCFRNVARVLEAGGAFVTECYVPNPARFERGKGVEVLAVDEHAATIEIYAFDLPAQRFLSQKVTFDGRGMRMRPHAERYAWPAELDLMAAQAGLRLEARYGGWDRRPFGPQSQSHVSVYRLE